MNIIELSEPKSVNFGGGIELLMNDKKSDIKLDEITNLEQELNELVFDSNMNMEPSPFTDLSKPLELFSFSDKPDIKEIKEINEIKHDAKDIKLGESTTQTSDTKTWDGFNKFNDAPILEKEPITKEELLREKLKILRKLEALESKGVNLSKKYNMESSLLEMQGEYELIMEEKNKQNSIKFQGNMLMACINGLEFLNNKFDPFDVKLEGWGEQINENINDYDEIFSELHEKYKSKAKIAPEVKLLFQLAGSGIMIHMTNSMFKTAVPGMDDILRQNPDLMKSFQTAAVNSMGNNPGFSGFMNGIMNPTSSSTYDVGGPPPPLATQGPNSIPPPMQRPGNNSSKPSMPTFKNPMSAALDSEFRPDMRGPTDITDLLSGLKTKTLDIHQSNSTISLSDLKDLDNDQLPKKSKRRKSDKNVIDLN